MHPYCDRPSSYEYSKHVMKTNRQKKIWVPRLSPMRVALICLLIGLFGARMLEGIEQRTASRFLVQIVPSELAHPGDDYPFDPAEGRELAGYARGGFIYECSWRVGGDQHRCLKDREDARKFIYDHWQSKTPAYVEIEFPCFDCAPTMHVFIEPDELGVWRIAIIHEEPRYPWRRSPDAYDVIYRKSDPDRDWSERSRRVLSFRNSTGEIDSF